MCEVWEGSSWLNHTIKHKALSVRPISITKSPWFVLEACSPLSCASLTPTPSHPGPPAAQVGLPTLFGACILYIVCVSVLQESAKPAALPPRQGPMPLSPATPCSHARLPAPQWSCLPSSISPLLIPLETGWRPNTLGVWGQGWGSGDGGGRQDQRESLDPYPLPLEQWFPTFFVRCTPTALSDELKNPFIDTTHHIPILFIGIDFKLDVIWHDWLYICIYVCVCVCVYMHIKTAHRCGCEWLSYPRRILPLAQCQLGSSPEPLKDKQV